VWRLAFFIVLIALAAGPLPAAGARQGGIALPFGEPVVGALDDQNFRQIYYFEVRAGDVIALTMSTIEGDLDAMILLTDERGVIIAESDDEGAGTDARIESKHIPADGRYFVIATRFGQEHGSTKGDYSLLLERVGTAAETPGTTTLRYGDSVLGTITQDAPMVFYFVQAKRGDVLNLVMKRTSGTLDPHVDLATVEGTILVANDDDPEAAGTLDAAIANYTVTQEGLYLIVATRFGREVGDTQGTYVLSLTQTPPEQLGGQPETARLLDYGMTLDGTIDDEVFERYYRFDASRGDVITVTLTAQEGNLDPLLKLLDQNLEELSQNDNSSGKDARIAAFTIPDTGSYYLLATRFGGQTGKTTGTFAIDLNGRAGVMGGQALEIMYGATVTGMIDAQQSSEEYVFMGQEGDVIRITMQRASGDLDSLVTLYDSQRKQLIFSDDDGGEKDSLIDEFVLPRDDMYFLVASRYERDAGITSGAYILTLELVRAG